MDDQFYSDNSMNDETNMFLTSSQHGEIPSHVASLMYHPNRHHPPEDPEISTWFSQGSYFSFTFAVAIIFLFNYYENIRQWMSCHFPPEATLQEAILILWCQTKELCRSIWHRILHIAIRPLQQRKQLRIRTSTLGSLPELEEVAKPISESLSSSAQPQFNNDIFDSVGEEKKEYASLESLDAIVSEIASSQSSREPLGAAKDGNGLPHHPIDWSNQELEPAFLNDSDYPPGWMVYHSLLGVVAKNEAEEYERRLSKNPTPEVQEEGANELSHGASPAFLKVEGDCEDYTPRISEA
jgi:hypothetical protein